LALATGPERGSLERNRDAPRWRRGSGTLQQGGVYVVMIAVTFMWVRFNRATLDDAFSPFSLLLPFWILPYLGSLLNLSEFQRGLSLEGHVLVVSATMGMVLPSLAASYLL